MLVRPHLLLQRRNTFLHKICFLGLFLTLPPDRGQPIHGQNFSARESSRTFSFTTLPTSMRVGVGVNTGGGFESGGGARGREVGGGANWEAGGGACGAEGGD